MEYIVRSLSESHTLYGHFRTLVIFHKSMVHSIQIVVWNVRFIDLYFFENYYRFENERHLSYVKQRRKSLNYFTRVTNLPLMMADILALR